MCDALVSPLWCALGLPPAGFDFRPRFVWFVRAPPSQANGEQVATVDVDTTLESGRGPELVVRLFSSGTKGGFAEPRLAVTITPGGGWAVSGGSQAARAAAPNAAAVAAGGAPLLPSRAGGGSALFAVRIASGQGGLAHRLINRIIINWEKMRETILWKNSENHHKIWDAISWAYVVRLFVREQAWNRRRAPGRVLLRRVLPMLRAVPPRSRWGLVRHPAV